MEINKYMRKPVKGYEGIYEVDNKGCVFSLECTYRSGNKCAERLRKGTVNSNGYVVVGLSKNGKSKMFQMHRLVAIAFIENPEEKRVVNHKDLDKTNNDVENLEWMTHAENTMHAIHAGAHIAGWYDDGRNGPLKTPASQSGR